MMCQILSQPSWAVRLTTDGYRGMTPLIYGDVNPYGVFDLDLAHRLNLDEQLAA